MLDLNNCEIIIKTFSKQFKRIEILKYMDEIDYLLAGPNDKDYFKRDYIKAIVTKYLLTEDGFNE